MDDVLKELNKSWPYHCYGGKELTTTTIPLELLQEATREIERLRAGQFRWTDLKDASPMGDCRVLCLWPEGNITTLHVSSVSCYDRITHWAYVPPLPEVTQEEKDEELWQQCVLTKDPDDRYEVRNAEKRGFLAGLKAARGEK